MKIESSMTIQGLEYWLKRCPLVAILRGIKPGEALDIGMLLVDTGFTIIEVPLNSPEPFASIVRLAKGLGGDEGKSEQQRVFHLKSPVVSKNLIW